MQWLGKMWDEFYSVPSNHSADAYVDPFDDYIEENGTGQDVEENVQDKEQAPVEEEDVHDSSLEEEEPIAARTRSHDSETIATRTRRPTDLTDIAGFADIKSGSNLNEWLNEIAFVTSELSDPSEPQTFWKHGGILTWKQERNGMMGSD